MVNFPVTRNFTFPISVYLITGKFTPITNKSTMATIIPKLKSARFFSQTLLLQPSIAKWRKVFITASAVYAVCCTVYLLFSSGQRQPWDCPPEQPTNPEDGKKDEKRASQETTRA